MAVAALVALSTPLCAQEEPTAGGKPEARARDEAAVKDAVNGWWTKALSNRDQRLGWWREAKFGCFIHWGVYSDPAGEYNGRRGGSYSEHIMRQLTIPRQEYLENVVAQFNPEKFDAEAWIKLIHDAGMRYLVITAKHHDGFAMYPSDVTNYNIHDATKFPRDPMKELSEACKKQGVHFGFYYSHAFDWEHPDAPGNDWDYKNPGGDKHLFDEKTGPNKYTYWYDVHPELVEKAKKYVDEKCIPQLIELIDKYHPEIFWFDVGGKLPVSEQLRIVKAVREHDPNVVINGRAARGMGKNFGDYVDTADNPAEVREHDGDWEAIPTVNNSYGYNKLDDHYKTPEFFIRLIAKITAKGGNTLLNIGPRGDGTIDENATRILRGIGKWMAVNGESIHGCTRTPLDRQAWGDSTLKGNTLYLHVFQWPKDGKLVVGGFKSDISNAYLLPDADKKPLASSRLNADDVLVQLPSQAPDATDSVIVARCKGEVKASKGRLLATNIPENQLLAFDATPSGKFTYGDGKADRYAVSGFTKPDDHLAWPVRLNEPATFDVSVRYIATKPAKLTVAAGEAVAAAEVATTKDSKSPQLASLGQLKLAAGEYELRFKPESPAGELSVLEILLKSASGQSARGLFNGNDLSGFSTFIQGERKDQDSTHVFSVDDDGAIHLYKDADESSKPSIGYLATKEEFSDYHLRFQYKWGEKRFAAKPAAKRNSGLLYDIVGPDGGGGGGGNGIWPCCVQCQVQQKSTGEIVAMGTSVTSTIDPAKQTPTYKDAKDGGVAYSTPASAKGTPKIAASELAETAEWNTVELIVRGDTAVHIVNGKVVARLSDAKAPDFDAKQKDAPPKMVALIKGRIGFQAEGFEVMYRNIEIEPLGR